MTALAMLGEQGPNTGLEELFVFLCGLGAGRISAENRKDGQEEINNRNTRIH